MLDNPSAVELSLLCRQPADLHAGIIGVHRSLARWKIYMQVSSSELESNFYSTTASKYARRWSRRSQIARPGFSWKPVKYVHRCKVLHSFHLHLFSKDEKLGALLVGSITRYCERGIEVLRHAIRDKLKRTTLKGRV